MPFRPMDHRRKTPGEKAASGQNRKVISVAAHSDLMEITPLGDSALIVRVRERFDDAPEKTLAAVLEVVRRLEAAQIPGVIEVAPAYTTVAVFFDPVRVIEHGVEPDSLFEWLGGQIREVVAMKGARKKSVSSRLIEIPVCYDIEFGLDLDEVAHHCRLSAAEIITRHSAVDYRVNCLGFTPGFPFLSGLPLELATPRRAVPRKKIPAGSVAIGGGQTGIYPSQSPGGWNVIGRTPRRLFTIEEDPPALLRAGDHVRFRAITRSEFENWKE
jgi:inhibitor of KinA